MSSNEDAIERFIEASDKRAFGPGQDIISAGATPRSLYLLLEGSVSVITRAARRELVLAYLTPGDFFGEMSLFPEHKTRSAIVRARVPVLVAEVELEVFRNFAHEHPEIMFRVAGQLAARLRNTSRRLHDLAFIDVAGRCAREVLDQCRRPDAVPTEEGTLIRVSRQELARLVGCSREMAGRVLKRLQEDHMIESRGRAIMVFKTR